MNETDRTERPRPTLSGRPPGAKDGKEHSPGSQPQSAARIRADHSDRPRSFEGAIIKLFRDVKKAVTRHAPAPQPKQSRRSKGESGSGCFRLFAAILTRRHAGSGSRLQQRVHVARSLPSKEPDLIPLEKVRRDEPPPQLSAQELALWRAAHPTDQHLPPGVQIAELLAMGWTIPQIRAAYPGLFNDAPPPVSHAAATGHLWDTLDWLNQWHSDPLTHYDPASEYVDASPSNHLSLHL